MLRRLPTTAGELAGAICIPCSGQRLRNSKRDMFVPMAEEIGHIQALTEWVMARVRRVHSIDRTVY
jgi:hypothetical protein